MGRVRLGELLIQEKKIDSTQLESALSYQRRWGRKLGECIVQLGFMKEMELCETLGRSLKIPLINLMKVEAAKITRSVLDTISISNARTHRVVPLAIKEFQKKKRLIIATSDPTNYKFFDDLQFKTSLANLVMISPDSDIEWFIRRYYLNEVDSLPFNYISNLDFPTEPSIDRVPEPISSIFYDSDFTGVSTPKRTPQSAQGNRKNK